MAFACTQKQSFKPTACKSARVTEIVTFISSCHAEPWNVTSLLVIYEDKRAQPMACLDISDVNVTKIQFSPS